MSGQLHSCLADPEEGERGGEGERRMKFLHSLYDILMVYQASDDFISGRE